MVPSLKIVRLRRSKKGVFRIEVAILTEVPAALSMGSEKRTSKFSNMFCTGNN